MIEFTASEISVYYSARVPGLKKIGSELRAPCPVHKGKDNNFSVNTENGFSRCFSQCGRGWDILSLEQALTSCDFPTAKERVFHIVGRPIPTWEDRDIEATYDYCDQAGNLAYQVVRRHGKKFAQRRPDGRGGWLWGLGGAIPLPFQLPKVIAADFVAVCEGERDCLTLTREGVTATCNNGGAGNFKAELATWFQGKRVAIFYDNDDPGRQHALKVASILKGNAASIRIVELPGLPEKGDVSDFLAAGGTIDQIRGRYAKAQDWTPEWQFSSEIPDPNDRYVRSLKDELEAAGSLDSFWDFRYSAGVPTPWEKLTLALRGGMRRGEVYMLGANQGSGKTSMALQFASRALRARMGVIYFSMEMGWRDIFHRLISMEARVDLLEFEHFQREGGNISDMVQRLQLSTSEFAQYPLLVSTKPRVTPEYLLKETDRLKKRQPVHLVIVDHMQLMGASGSIRGDYEKFTAISRVMKETAREADLPVLLVSQTTRQNSADHRQELEVSDLRGSGALEEDAAVVLLLYPDKDDSTRTKANSTFAMGPVKTWLKVGKNRYGHSGIYLPLSHAKRWTRFDLYQKDEGKEFQ